MENIISFVSAHYKDVAAIFGAAVVLASLIVKITPTTKDDTVLDFIKTWADKLSIFYPKPTVK